MFLNSTFKLAIIKEPPLEVLELPYIDNELSMFILLPKDIGDKSTGLEQVKAPSLITYVMAPVYLGSHLCIFPIV